MHPVGNKPGFSIIELVIALAIGVMVISGVVLAADSVTRAEMDEDKRAFAEELLEKTNALAREDFNLVNPFSASSSIYRASTTVELLSDFVSKRINVSVQSASVSAALPTVFSTLVTNVENPYSTNTCDSTPAGNWSSLDTNSMALSGLSGVPPGTYTISDVDAYRHMLYVSAERTTLPTDPTLFVFDISGGAPTLRGMIDNNASTSGGTAGIAALRVVDDFSAGKRYLFAANAGGFAKGQLHVFDVTDPANPALLITYKIPIGLVPSAGNGNSIFYRNGYVYLGLTGSASLTQFDIIDVHTPSAPVWKGGYAIGNGVEKIIVFGELAYLATSNNSQELMILNVGEPTAPWIRGVYNFTGPNGSGFGKSVSKVGTKLFFGRTWVFNTANVPELTILDVSNPASPSVIGSRDVGPNTANPYGVYGFIARDSLIFALTKASSGGQLLVLSGADPSVLGSEMPIASTTLPSGSGGAALDCESNALYIASNDSSGNGYITVVRPAI